MDLLTFIIPIVLTLFVMYLFYKCYMMDSDIQMIKEEYKDFLKGDAITQQMLQQLQERSQQPKKEEEKPQEKPVEETPPENKPEENPLLCNSVNKSENPPAKRPVGKRPPPKMVKSRPLAPKPKKPTEQLQRAVKSLEDIADNSDAMKHHLMQEEIMSKMMPEFIDIGMMTMPFPQPPILVNQKHQNESRIEVIDDKSEFEQPKEQRKQEIQPQREIVQPQQPVEKKVSKVDDDKDDLIIEEFSNKHDIDDKKMDTIEPYDKNHETEKSIDLEEDDEMELDTEYIIKNKTKLPVEQIRNYAKKTKIDTSCTVNGIERKYNKDELIKKLIEKKNL
jgi:hypothetical protein